MVDPDKVVTRYAAAKTSDPDRVRKQIDREADKALREVAKELDWKLKKTGWGRDGDEWEAHLKDLDFTCKIFIFMIEEDDDEFQYSFMTEMRGQRREKARAVQYVLQKKLKEGDVWEDPDKFLRFIKYELADAFIEASEASEYD